MLIQKLKNYRLLLASASPRRKHLLEELGVNFEVLPRYIEEIIPEGLSPKEVAEYLSKLKSDAFSGNEIGVNTIVLTADTIVALKGEILGKPVDSEDAVKILNRLSGNSHKVITGVTLKTNKKLRTFSVTTEVIFKKLLDEEIRYYVDNFKPYDKAGAYGIQEWIGHVAIEKIKGSYFNVMGLPTHKLYEELLSFID